MFRREKDGAQPNFCYMVYLIKVDMSFSQNAHLFVLVSTKLKCQILSQAISDATKIDIYHAMTLEIQREKSSLIQLHISFYNED